MVEGDVEKIMFCQCGAKKTLYSFLRRLGAGGLMLAVFLGAGAPGRQISLLSLAMNPGGPMPKKFTAEGQEISPPLVWSNLPDETQELALIFEDLDVPRVHWVVYRIPAKAGGLPQRLPRGDVLTKPDKLSGTIQGLTGFRGDSPGYHGPNPSHSKLNHYRFTIYALDARLGLQPGLDKPSLLILIQDHVIGEGALNVTYTASR